MTKVLIKDRHTRHGISIGINTTNNGADLQSIGIDTCHFTIIKNGICLYLFIYILRSSSIRPCFATIKRLVPQIRTGVIFLIETDDGLLSLTYFNTLARFYHRLIASIHFKIRNAISTTFRCIISRPNLNGDRSGSTSKRTSNRHIFISSRL